MDLDVSDFVVDEREVHEIRWFTKEEALAELKESPEEFLHNMEERVRGF